MKDKLQEITEYLIEDAYACMVDTEAGEPGAEADLFKSLQRLKTFADAVQGLEAADGCDTPASPPPKCYQREGGNGYEYICESYGSSRDSDEEYIIDLHPDHFGCSCKHDDYVLRPKRKQGVDTSNICKHTALAMQQFYIDHIINKKK